MNQFYLALIYPIEILLETFYVFFLKIINNNGLAIIGLSIVVSAFLLPLYHVAESIQKKEREIQKELEPKIKRIKSVFSSDERYMILSTLYRQHNYKPIYALRNSISLILQVPFFIATYNFLNNLPSLDGVQFYFISNLSQPDSLLKIGTFSVNILPIAMTIINLVAGFVYSKNLIKREKIQLLIIPLVFLVLLYNAPSALVFYWTCNNFLSLVKNVVYRFKKPQLFFYFISVLAVVSLAVAVLLAHPLLSNERKLILFLLIGVVVTSPLLMKFVKMTASFLNSKHDTGHNLEFKIFLISVLFMFVLHGVLIPTNLIASSVSEFSYIENIENPLNYIKFTATFFFGLWLLWASFVYFIIPKKGRSLFSFAIATVAIVSTTNLFVFKGEYGIINYLLNFENSELLYASNMMIIVPVLVALLIVTILFVIYSKKRKYIFSLMLIFTFSASTLAGYQILSINKDFLDYKVEHLILSKENVGKSNITPAFKFSKDGKNILFIFLDRALGSYFPFVIQEVPELKDQLSGFTYYPNTVSFGTNTIIGVPAMVGGYEYTPDLINARNEEKLVDKHNEALLVLPTLFSNLGYEVTVTNPPWSDYKEGFSSRPFSDLKNVNVVNQHKQFNLEYKKDHSHNLKIGEVIETEIIKARLLIFSFFKTVFPVLREAIYDNGDYYRWKSIPNSIEGFLDWYAPLHYLINLTSISDEGNYYINISNNTPHQPVILQTPQFEPWATVTNSKTILDKITGLKPLDISSYHANVASLKRLGIWFDFLRDSNVYDNTRIIVVADHGYPLYSEGMEHFSQKKYSYNHYVPLLLVKDFESRDSLKIDSSFMTNADAPIFAIEGIVDYPINPFTNKNLIESIDKNEVSVYTGPWNPQDHFDNIFKLDIEGSYKVKDNIFDESNWKSINKLKD